MNTGYLTCGRNSASDEVNTPFYGVEPIIKYLPENKKIWCPFDKLDSAFVRFLSEQGFNVTYSHKDTNQDFFDYEPENWDIIVSNPPFSIKDQVLARCYELNKPFALLLLLNSLQGQKRFSLFEQGIEILAFDKRIDYHTHGNILTSTNGCAFASAYYCRYLLPEKLILEKLVKYERSLEYKWSAK